MYSCKPKECVVCGFVFRPLRPTQLTCSVRCGSHSVGLVGLGNKRQKRTPLNTNCERCQVAIARFKNSRDVVRFCSKACSDLQRTESKRAKRSVVKPRETRCVGCGVEVVGMNIRCRPCKLNLGRAKENARTEAKRLASGLSPSPLTCKRCKSVFTPEIRQGGWSRRKFCSASCGQRFQRAKAKRGRGTHAQRAKRVGAPRDYSVHRFKVFERDGWRCQLCGVSTPKSLNGTYEDRAPELDHIVPFAAGGGHTWDNVQCSCRKCNAAKGCKPLGQMRLGVGAISPLQIGFS
jgi:5-methylcytosine-specific restriction endonuclease McrA